MKAERAEPIVGKVEKTLEIHSAFGSDIDATKVDVVVLDGVRFYPKRYAQPCADHEYIDRNCPDCGKLETDK